MLLLSTWNFGRRSNSAGWSVLSGGGGALDAVEAVARFAEADRTNHTVGIGGRPDANGDVSLDAAVMQSPARGAGVANVRRFGHPISIARRVMETTPHKLLAGAAADDFAAAAGFEPAKLLTATARRDWEKWRDSPAAAFAPKPNIERDENHDTIGVLARDARGELAAACSTSGLAFKLPGRVGDSPIIGHALYVDPKIGAAVATGHGELVMGVCGAFLAVEHLRNNALPLAAAVATLNRIADSYPLNPSDQVGLIVLAADGSWSGASLRTGFQIAVRDDERDELVEPHVVLG